MNKLFLILFSVSIFCNSVSAQLSHTDSLEQLLSKEVSSKEKIDACKQLSISLSLNNFTENIKYARKGLNIASAENDSASVAILLNNLGFGHYFSGHFDSASFYYYKSISLLEKRKMYPELAEAYNRLARLYRKTKSLTRAHQFYAKAMDLYKQMRDRNGIATIYNEDGVVYEYEEKYDDALKNYNASLAIDRQLNDSVGIGYALNFIAGVYVLQKKFTEAENYLQQTMDIRQALKDTFTVALTWSDFGSLYKESGDYAKAIEALQKSNATAEKINYPELMLTNYKMMSEAASLQKNYADAYNYFSAYSSLKDSIYNIESNKQIEELSAKYETAEKEKQIQEQQFQITKKNYWLTGIAVLFITFSMLSYSWYKRYQLKQRSEMQASIIHEREIATKAVMDAEENERKRIAGDLHDGVGQTMSAARMNLSALSHAINFETEEQKNNFDKIKSLIDESCNEVRTVSHNMMPGSLSKKGLAHAVKEFTDKINQDVLKINFHSEGFDKPGDVNAETVLYRIIQECVNNVLKHAKATALDISIIKDKDGTSISIEDNGGGFNSSLINKNEGIGLKNIKARVAFLKGTVEWESSPGRGTLVAIHVS